MDKKDQSKLSGISQVSNSKPYQYPKRNIGLVRATLSGCMLVITAVLSACSPSASNLTPVSTASVASVPQATTGPNSAFTTTATSMPQNVAIPTQAFTPTATSVAQQTAVNTPLDPCLLISSQDASTLAGASFGKGEEETTPDGLRICTYGSQTSNVFVVDVVQAPDLDTANAYKAQFLADLQAHLQQLTKQGLNITELPNFADGATMADASINNGGITINGGAIGFLKGTIFFGFSDVVVGAAAPNSAALQSEATTVLGELP